MLWSHRPNQNIDIPYLNPAVRSPLHVYVQLWYPIPETKRCIWGVLTWPLRIWVLQAGFSLRRLAWTCLDLRGLAWSSNQSNVSQGFPRLTCLDLRGLAWSCLSFAWPRRQQALIQNFPLPTCLDLPGLACACVAQQLISCRSRFPVADFPALACTCLRLPGLAWPSS